MADGSTNIASINGSIDTATLFVVGAFPSEPPSADFRGELDELQVWNFGFGGLPEDYAAYIAWRAQGRNVFLDISEYGSGSWNGYADAFREEKVTDGGLEDWSDATHLVSWDELNVSAGVRDITREDTEKHGGSYAVKLEATNNDGTHFNLRQDISLTVNKYYEFNFWHYFLSRTAGSLEGYVYNGTDSFMGILAKATVDAAYTRHAAVFSPTIAASKIYLYLLSETTTGILYFDDISVKRVGLVGHWKFEGDLSDETSNSNDLTAGGSGNTFPGYTLKRQKIISPAWIR